jgi:hypothetical protein
VMKGGRLRSSFSLSGCSWHEPPGCCSSLEAPNAAKNIRNFRCARGWHRWLDGWQFKVDRGCGEDDGSTSQSQSEANGLGLRGI